MRESQPGAQNGVYSGLCRLLFRPVDPASLAAFRIGFGLFGMGYVAHLLAEGRIARHWIEPSFHFHYPGFGWAAGGAGDALYLHVAVMAVCAGCMAAGAFYRVTAPLFALGFTRLFLLEASEFENHHYVFLLLSWILAFSPAHRAFAFDAWRRGRGSPGGEWIPVWPLLLLRTQWGIIFFFGSISKLNADWLQGWPLLLWLPDAPRIALLGPFFDQPWMAFAWGYTGIAFDLTIVPLLLYRPTRDFALVALFLFFSTAYLVLGVGFFAAIGLLSATIFYPADWPRSVPGVPAMRDSPWKPPPIRRQQWAALVLIAFVATQILFPLRHALYDGDPSWTEEGHQFAWRMMLRDKRADLGFRITDPHSGEQSEPNLREWLTERQIWKMARRPELIRQFAHHLSREHGDAEVHVDSSVSLNGRRRQPLVDPAVNLAAEPYRWGTAPWISPLTEELRPRSAVLAEPRGPYHPPR